MAKGHSLRLSSSLDNRLFGERNAAMECDSWFDVVDESQAKLVAECLLLELPPSGKETRVASPGGSSFLPIKQEVLDDDVAFSEGHRNSQATDQCEQADQKFSTIEFPVKEEGMLVEPSLKRDALDDEIDALLNWRPTRKILLSESDKKRQQNRTVMGLKSSELDYIVNLCKGCRKCNLAGLQMSNRSKKLKNVNAKFGALLAKNTNNLTDAQRKQIRRNRNPQESRNIMGNTSSSRPRTRSQLTNLKGKVDFLEQTSLENSSIKVLRSRSFFLPKVTNNEEQKPKLKPRIAEGSKLPTLPQSAQQAKTSAARKRARTHIWNRRRKRLKQRKTTPNLKSESEDLSKGDLSRKLKTKASRWDDFIRRQREALQQFQGDGKEYDSGKRVNPVPDITEEKPMSKNNKDQQSNLFDKLSIEQDRSDGNPKKAGTETTTSQFQEVKESIKTPTTTSTASASSSTTTKLLKTPEKDKKYSDSALSSEQTYRTRSRNQQLKSEVIKSEPPKTTEAKKTGKPVVIFAKGKVGKTVNVVHSKKTTNATSATALLIPNASPSPTKSVPSTSLVNTKMPLYVPVNYQGRTLLCPVIPASKDILKFATQKTKSEGTESTTSMGSTTTANSTTTLSVSSTPNQRVATSANLMPHSNNPTNIHIVTPSGALAVAAQKNAFTMPVQSQSVLYASKLKSILPMPIDPQSPPKFPQFVVLKQSPVADKSQGSIQRRDSEGTATNMGQIFPPVVLSPVKISDKIATVVSDQTSAKLIQTASKTVSTHASSTSTQPISTTTTTVAFNTVTGMQPNRTMVQTSPQEQNCSTILQNTGTSSHTTPGQPQNSAVPRATILRPIRLMGNGTAPQLLPGASIRLGVPITLAAAMHTDGNLISADVKLQIPQSLGGTVQSSSVTPSVNGSKVNDNDVSSELEPVKTNLDHSIHTPQSEFTSQTSSLGIDLVSNAWAIRQLRRKKRQLCRMRAMLKRRMRNRRSKTYGDITSSSESSSSFSDSSGVSDFESDMAAEYFDVASPPASPRKHPYNTRLRVRHNKMRIVRTDGDTWRVAESTFNEPNNTESCSDSVELARTDYSSASIATNSETEKDDKLPKTIVEPISSGISHSVSSGVPQSASSGVLYSVSSTIAQSTSSGLSRSTSPGIPMCSSLGISQPGSSGTGLGNPVASQPFMTAAASSISSSVVKTTSTTSQQCMYLRRVSTTSVDSCSTKTASVMYRTGVPIKLALPTHSATNTTTSLCSTTVSINQVLPQQFKAASSPFNALLLKQPDGSLKLQLLQPSSSGTSGGLIKSASITTPVVSTVSISPTQNHSKLLATSISPVTTTHTSEALEDTDSPAISDARPVNVMMVGQSNGNGGTMTLVPLQPQPEGSEEKICTSGLPNALSSTSQITKISVATDQLRKMLKESNSTGTRVSNEHGAGATRSRFGDKSDHLYAKLKPGHVKKGTNKHQVKTVDKGLSVAPSVPASLIETQTNETSNDIYFEDINEIHYKELGQEEKLFTMVSKDTVPTVVPKRGDYERTVQCVGLEKTVDYINELQPNSLAS